MTLTLDATQADVLITRAKPSLALAAAGFVTQLRGAKIVVAQRDDYADLRISLFPRGSTIFFIDLLRFQLLRYPCPHAQQLAQRLVRAGHTLVVLDDACPVNSAALDAMAESQERSYTRLLHQLFPRPSVQANWLAHAADCASFGLATSSAPVTKLVEHARRYLGHLDFPRCKMAPDDFVAHVAALAAV